MLVMSYLNFILTYETFICEIVMHVKLQSFIYENDFTYKNFIHEIYM